MYRKKAVKEADICFFLVLFCKNTNMNTCVQILISLFLNVKTEATTTTKTTVRVSNIQEKTLIYTRKMSKKFVQSR